MGLVVHVVLGTRPEAHKLSTVVAGLRDRGWLGRVVFTGQHTDLLRAEQANSVWGLATDLGCPPWGDNPIAYAEQLSEDILDALQDAPKGYVMVQGDTASAYAGALAGQKLGWPVYHVEAGIRSHDTKEPWPEEWFRVEIDKIAIRGCCATKDNLANLVMEKLDDPTQTTTLPTRFPVTGNPGLDRSLALVPPTVHRQAHVLVTLHRRESFGPRLEALVEALCQWAYLHPDRPVYWPMHPNPRVKEAFDAAVEHFGVAMPLNLVPMAPQGHEAFLKLLSTAAAVVTDSGGVQEEASAYGIPCVVARQVTDRPESVEAGQAVLARPETLGKHLSRAVGCGLVSVPKPIYGDGKATERILRQLGGLA